MASNFVDPNLAVTEKSSHNDRQELDKSCSSSAVFPDSGQLDAIRNVDAAKTEPIERLNEQVSTSDIAELSMKMVQTDNNSGLVKDDEVKAENLQGDSEKERSAVSILPGSDTSCEISKKQNDPMKRSECKETKRESKIEPHSHSSRKIATEHGDSNRDKDKAHKHSGSRHGSHQSSSTVLGKSGKSTHNKPSSREHGSESRHHHHSNSQNTSKQKIDPRKEKYGSKLQTEDRKQSDTTAKPCMDKQTKDKATSETSAVCRKRKLTDSPSDDSSSSDALPKKTVLSQKRAKLLALVDKRKSDQANSIPDDGSTDVATSSKSGTDGFQFPASAHLDLITSAKLVYEPIGLICTSKFVKEAESGEYAAGSFSLNKRPIRFRVAKTTPTKNGQFVTFWKRIGKGPIMPYDAKDPVDLLVVCVRDGKNAGQFVFPKSTLIAQDVMSSNGKGGKRAIRVYPPWVKAESTQAMNTQCWQAKHFLNMTDKTKLDLQRARRLYAA